MCISAGEEIETSGKRYAEEHTGLARAALAPEEPYLSLQTQHQLLQIKMYIRFRIRAMHLDAVLSIRSVALVHPAEVRGREAPITIRNGATDDGGVRHAGMLSRHYDTDMIWCWRGSRRPRRERCSKGIS